MQVDDPFDIETGYRPVAPHCGWRPVTQRGPATAIRLPV